MRDAFEGGRCRTDITGRLHPLMTLSRPRPRRAPSGPPTSTRWALAGAGILSRFAAASAVTEDARINFDSQNGERPDDPSPLRCLPTTRLHRLDLSAQVLLHLRF